VDPKMFVWVDECGTHTCMRRLRARAPKGERAYGSVPRNRGKNTTLIASMTLGGAMGECMAVEGSTKAVVVFEAYVERFLAPSLSPGRVVVIDNLSAHKTGRVRELIEGRGCELWFLPSYSPDLNPIEEAFSKVRGVPQKGCGAHARGPGGSDGRGALGGHAPGRQGVVRSLWLRVLRGPILMNTAVGWRLFSPNSTVLCGLRSLVHV
jgi:DDE superfamily endonuclease